MHKNTSESLIRIARTNTQDMVHYPSLIDTLQIISIPISIIQYLLNDDLNVNLCLLIFGTPDLVTFNSRHIYVTVAEILSFFLPSLFI